MLPRARFVVLISADGEWQAVLHHTLPSIQHPTPYGNWFSQNIDHFSVIFMHAGWGKSPQQELANLLSMPFNPS